MTEEWKGGGRKPEALEGGRGHAEKSWKGEAFVFLSFCFTLIRQVSVSEWNLNGRMQGGTDVEKSGNPRGEVYHDTNLSLHYEGSWKGKYGLVLRKRT